MSDTGDGTTAVAKCPEGSVLIPRGAFQMGCDDHDDKGNELERLLPRCNDIEAPPHPVEISQPFCIDEYTFTERKMEELKRAKPGRFDHIKTTCNIDAQTGLLARIKRRIGLGPVRATETCEKPLVGVTWHDAAAICSARGMRLPTEAQWEYAARGVSGIDEYMGQPTERMEYQLKKFRSGPVRDWRLVVDRTMSNSWGVYGMSDNIREWVSDWLGPYSPSAVQDPAGPATGYSRVLRGGSWVMLDLSTFRTSSRYGADPKAKSDFMGFRCVADSISEK
ncbi:MAG: SUMF1/EgtB/PvdO family nonheme iron enzyme [Pseudomonadota bacterium]